MASSLLSSNLKIDKFVKFKKYYISNQLSLLCERVYIHMIMLTEIKN